LKPLSFENLAAQSIGRLVGEDITFSNLSTDTRTVATGDVFLAIEGERFNGHDFIEDALSKGASGLVLKADYTPLPNVPCLLVEDTTKALGQIAKVWASQFSLKKAAITGSCGKTTVKELVGGILSESFNTLMTQGNLNNEIGLPITLFRLKPEHEMAVYEIGANHAGEIAWTAGLIEPDVAVINNVGQAHLEGFGTVEQVAQAKSEIYDALKPDGVAVINLDDAFAPKWLEQTAQKRQLTYSIFNTKPADILLEKARYVPGEGSFMQVKTPRFLLELKTTLLGEHNWANVLAAVSIAEGLGISADAIIQGIAKVKAYHSRLQMIDAVYPDWFVVDDTYNANPTSTRIAIDLLATCSGHRVLVLGNMAELGDTARDLHQEVGAYARDRGVDQVIAIGPMADAVIEGFGGGQQCQEISEIVDSLKAFSDRPCSVLVKGSRSARMERVLESLKKHN